MDIIMKNKLSMIKGKHNAIFDCPNTKYKMDF